MRSAAQPSEEHTLPRNLDYSSYVTARSAGFVGREWVFREIKDWLRASEGPRIFMLTGEPGIGKTAIAAQLCRISSGEIPACLEPHFLSAVHFCSKKDNYFWLRPVTFVESVMRQLATSFPAFAEAVMRKKSRGDTKLDVEVHQKADNNPGTMIGCIVNIAFQGPSSSEAFNVLHDCLGDMFQTNHDCRVVILVDSLDQSMLYDDSPTIASLLADTMTLFPESVRFILTSRHDSDIRIKLEKYGPRKIDLSDNQESTEDIRTYMGESPSPEVQRAMDSGLRWKQFKDIVQERSKQNFLYVRVLFKMITRETHGAVTIEYLQSLPTDLNEFYLRFLHSLVPEGSAGDYVPLLGILAVAFEDLHWDNLNLFINPKNEPSMELGLLKQLRQLRQLLRLDDALVPRQRKYAFYHDSFAEFLLYKDYETFSCRAAAWHKCIVQSHQKRPIQEWNEYDLRYATRHLRETIELSDNVAERHTLTERLVELVKSPDFQKRRSNDIQGLQGDLEIAVRQASRDDDPRSAPLVIKSAFAWQEFRKQSMRPQQIFELAKVGKLDKAQHQLDLFDIDGFWYQAIRLDLAWLAASTNRKQAHALLSEIRPYIFDENPLKKLVQYLDTALKPLAEDLLQPETNTEDDQRMEGFCGECSKILDKLAQLHALYPYDTYRNDSLWNVVDWMTDCCNSPEFFRDWTAKLAVAALTPNRPQFVRTLAWTVLALKARIHVDRARANLDARRQDIITESINTDRDDPWRRPRQELKDLITTCKQFTGVGKEKAEQLLVKALYTADQIADSYEQRKIDPWAFLRRDLMVLAQVYMLLLKEPATDLLRQAMRGDLYGSASCHTLAFLCLAEIIQMIMPGHRLAYRALRSASELARKVRNPHTCALHTSRVCAMRSWWPGPPTWEQVIKRFSEHPNSPEFAAVHSTEETYNDRPELEDFRQATTLEKLASAYGCSPLELQELNPGLAPNKQFASGTKAIKVPDRGFAPLLACRITAGVISDSSLNNQQKMRDVQALVPTAMRDPTALSTVLSRLLLVALPSDTALLDDLTGIAKEWQAQT